MFLNDEMLRHQIDHIFKKYDKDNSGTLDSKELAKFMTNLYKSMGLKREATQEDALELIRKVDINGDGKMNKYEMYLAFKGMTKESFDYNQYKNQYKQDHKMQNPFGQEPKPNQQQNSGNQPYMQNPY